MRSRTISHLCSRCGRTQPGAGLPGIDRLKSLQGTWTGRSKRGGESVLTYTVIGRGSAVEENYRDTDHDQMLTVFYLENDELILRHYCVAKNQPRMRATSFNSTTGELKFDFIDATNFSSGGGHMHNISLRLIDADHLVSGAAYFKNGQLQFSESTAYTRSPVESQQSLPTGK